MSQATDRLETLRPSGRVYVSIAYTHADSDPRIRRHCEALARRGWSVYQIGLGREGDARVARLNGVVLVRLSLQRYRGSRLLSYLTSYVRFLTWARGALRRIMRRGPGVHVVQANNIPNFMVWAATPARRAGAGILLDIHDPVPELFLAKFGRTWWTRILADLLKVEERVAISRADGVIVTTEAHREVLADRGVPPEKLTVVANYADGELFPRRAPKYPAPLLSYHGTVLRRLGLDVAVRALVELRQRLPEARMMIWGDGDAVEELRSLRDELGAPVELSGSRIPVHELVPRLERVGIGVVPARRDPTHDLVLPTKLMEYVRLGIPAVVTWTPSVASYFPEDTVRYVRTLTPAALAEAIEDLLRNPEAARERVRRAQELPIARAWQEVEEEYVALIAGHGDG